MNWSREQEKALAKVGRWLKKKDKPIFRLFGYAGSGKSTLAKHLAKGVKKVKFAAYTGKAAHVMSKKGCPGAQTIHSLIYHPQDKSKSTLLALQKDLDELTAELLLEGKDPERSPQYYTLINKIQEEKAHLSQPSFIKNEDTPLAEADLLIVDECSMVGEEMANDLLSFQVPILCLGDPGQLPPVRSTGYFTNAEPDVMLTEIHRQAMDNPVVKLATDVRQGKRLEVGTYGTSSVSLIRDFDYDTIDPDQTQVLVGKNKTRRRANLRIRKNKYGDDLLLSDGEKLVALRNDKDTGVLNGSLWKVERVDAIYEDAICAWLKDEDSELTFRAGFWRHHIEGNENALADMGWGRRDYLEFDYGYALTVHKSQGSEWPDVFLVNESWGAPDYRRRWLYTGITRASDRIRIVQ